ncbi:putative Transcriptional regulator, LysR family protein [Nostocoides japonicum T1-X7]|uniref:Putative Transcriptional regulator, LysR family protein n=1 Tax=Nostocoides japonicum T1-X7 TaxID=1194083 RepID=A0A077LTP7_9MICO|nr:LysR family transcriptional regulator [Tetrasphaera japonica]CCH75872.1 putative Transcriptional regulator, LysR family protein [Tetrasphaera japonica T1-X7]
MDDVTMPQLRAIVTLARTKTIAAAAAELGYTAGAISQQLAGLEKAVGVRLLVHVGRRVELTDAGLILARHGATILDDVLDAREAAVSTERSVSGTVEVGIFATSPAELFGRAVLLAGERHPDLEVRSCEIHVDAVSGAVRGHVVDLALGVEYPEVPLPRPDDLTVRTLVREPFALAVPVSWAGRIPTEPVDLSVGRDWPWVLPADDSHFAVATGHAFRRAGFEPRIVHGITDTAATCAMVAVGVAATLLTPMMAGVRATEAIRLVPLTSPPSRELVLIHRSGPMRPSVAAAAGVIEDVAAGVS